MREEEDRWLYVAISLRLSLAVSLARLYTTKKNIQWSLQLCFFLRRLRAALTKLVHPQKGGTKLRSRGDIFVATSGDGSVRPRAPLVAAVVRPSNDDHRLIVLSFSLVFVSVPARLQSADRRTPAPTASSAATTRNSDRCLGRFAFSIFYQFNLRPALKMSQKPNEACCNVIHFYSNSCYK